MKLFGFDITRAEKKIFKVYNNDCRYCSSWEGRGSNSYEYKGTSGDIFFGYCSELQQLTDSKMKNCKHKL